MNAAATHSAGPRAARATSVPATTPAVVSSVVLLRSSEQRMLSAMHRLGSWGFVIAMASIIALFSLVLTVLAIHLLVGLDAETVPPAALLGLGVPLLVAPPILHITCGLVARLDAARSLLHGAAVTDPLTGVFNRRGFFEEIEAKLGQSDSAGVVGMVDIDDFKQLNDHHGHAGGDHVLTAVAEWLVDHAAVGGIVGRLGGDEFAFIVHHVPESVIPRQQQFTVGAMEFSITVGSTRFTSYEGFDEALARADADLYRRKRSPVVAVSPEP